MANGFDLCYDSLDKQIEFPIANLGTPVEGYLIYKDPLSKELDPRKQATFLFRTKDGTCGAIRYVSIVDRVITKGDGPLSPETLPTNMGARLGVKVDF